MTSREGTVRILFRLSPAPDRDWASIFGGPDASTPIGARLPAGYEHPVGMLQPDIRGDAVTLDVPHGEVEKYVAKLDERIAATMLPRGLGPTGRRWTR
jgi:hypothetical protein